MISWLLNTLGSLNGVSEVVLIGAVCLVILIVTQILNVLTSVFKLR